MRFNDLKAALQPNIDGDLGKLYAEFVRKSGTGDLVRFIAYLKDEGYVDPKVLEELVSGGVIDTSAVQDLAQRNTPRPVGRLYAPTLMPDIDDDDDYDDDEPTPPVGPAPPVDEVSPAEDAAPVDEAADVDAAPPESAAEVTAAPARSEEEVAEAEAEAEADGWGDAFEDHAGSDAGVEVHKAPVPAEAIDVVPVSAPDAPVDAESAPPADAFVAAPDTAADEAAAPAEAAQPASAESEEDAETAAGDAVAVDAASATENDTPADAAASDDSATSGTDTGARPKRRSEATSTGSRRRSGARSTGSRRKSERRDTGSRRKAGSGRTTSARDRLKRTMFSLRQQAEQTQNENTDLLRRDYKFVGKVGEGAMGRVLKAKDNDLLRLVAYKEMSEQIAADPALSSKFYAEAQITAQLDHPNIVPVYQLEQSADGMLAYTMKLIKGKTFEDYIDEVKEAYEHDKRKLPEEYTLGKRLDLFLRCCDALYYAHRRGIVHRDLKPENIMMGAYGEVYIMDWGIAKVVKNSDIITEDRIELLYEPQEEGDLIIGTPQYMSPEQANGDNDSLDHLSDMYSMGLILYELVSLHQAVTGKSAMKIVMRGQDGEKDPLKHAYGDKIPRELRAIIEKSTAKDRSQRYPHIKALADDIRHYVRDEAVIAKPDSIGQAMGRWVRRHTALTAFVVLTLLFIMGVGVISVGAGAVIYNSLAAQRVSKLNGLRSAVFAQASKIDGQFIKYEGLLGTIAATASEKLTLSGAEGRQVFMLSDFDGGTEQEVPGTATSARYGTEINLEYPVFVMADPESEAAQRNVAQLSDIGGHLRTVLLRSESEEAARFTPARYKRRIGSQGTPITWAFLGLESGAFVLYPGKGGLGNFDPREQPWYEETKKVAKRQPGPRWSVPFADYHGQGYVLTVSQPIYDTEDALLGVAGVSLTFDYIIDSLLQVPENIGGVSEVLILNEKGERIISSEDRGKKPEGGRTRAKRMSVFDVQEVVDGVTSLEGGGTVFTDRDGVDELIFYTRMEGLDWYLVVIGDNAEMLASEI